MKYKNTFTFFLCLVFCSIVAGYLISLVSFGPSIRGYKDQINRLRKDSTELRQEINQLNAFLQNYERTIDFQNQYIEQIENQ